MPSKATRPVELEYRVRSTIKKAQVIAALNEDWRDAIKNNADVRAVLKLRAGEAAPKELRKAPYDVSRKGAVFSAAATILVAAKLAGIRIGHRVVMDLWQKIFFPRLEDRFGLKPKAGAARSARRATPARSGRKKTVGSQIKKKTARRRRRVA